MPWHDGLTDKQRAFVEEYLVDLNGTRAAIRAGYSAESASSIAYENLRKPQIAAAIDAALAERPGVTRTRIVDELAAIAFADIRNIVSWRPELTQAEPVEGEMPAIISRVTVVDSATIDPLTAAAIAEVSQGASGAVKVKLHDKPAALEKLGRVLGMFKERVEHSGDIGIRLDDARAELERKLARLAEPSRAPSVPGKPE